MKRKNKKYLIVSSSHLGLSEDILDIFSQVKKKYKAEVIHLGPTVSDHEFNKHQRLSEKIEEMKIKQALVDLTDRQEEALEEKIDTVTFERTLIEDEESSRVQQLRNTFGKDMLFVTTEKLSLPFRKDDPDFSFGGLELSKYLYLSPIPPTGMKSTRNPINSVAISYLKDKGRSWIVSHPVPSVIPFAKPGLNEAWNCYSVGSLRHQEEPERTNEQYQMAHMPCAILVTFDIKNGEFHAKQLHVDYMNKKFEHNSQPVVIDDGLVFTPKKVLTVKSKDKAVFSTDDHAPFTHPGQLAAVRAMNELHENEYFINGGDAADFGSVSRHTEAIPGERENMRLMYDLNNLRKLLDAQINTKTIKHKVLIDSNHHEWLSQFIERNPNLKGMLDWRTLANNMFSDWDLKIRSAGELDIYYFGDLPIRHGDEDGNAKKAEGIYNGGKYLCGHWHSRVSYRRSNQVGCGCMLGPKYIGGRNTPWQNMVTSITKYKGVTATSPKVVLHDKTKKTSRFEYRGEIYEVRHYKIDWEK